VEAAVCGGGAVESWYTTKTTPIGAPQAKGVRLLNVGMPAGETAAGTGMLSSEGYRAVNDTPSASGPLPYPTGR
jgi:hypothetical protein